MIDFIMELYQIILICVAVIIVIVGVIIAIFIIRKNKKIKESNLAADKKVEQSASHLSTCFGGSKNIVSISQKGSRVTLIVNDISLVDKETISKELPQVMYMNNKIVFVIGSMSEEFSKLLKDNIDKQI